MFVGGNALARRLVLLTVALVLVGASAAGAAEEYVRIREKAGEMLVSVNEARFKPWAEGKDSELEKAYGGYAYLFTSAKLDRLDEIVAEASDPAEKAKRALTADIIRYHAIRSKVAPLLDNLCNSLRENSIPVEEGQVVLWGLDHRIGCQADRDIRRKWWLAASQLYTGINVYRRSLLLDLNDQAKAVGEEGYYEFLRRVEGWNIELTRTTAEALLENTEASYLALLEEYAQSELGLEVRKVRTYDVDRLLFFPAISEKVSAVKLEKLLEQSFKESGVDLGKQRSLRRDLREKKGRNPEAKAHPLDYGKAEVTMIPTGQVSDFPDAMGAIGEAQFYYRIPRDVPFEEAVAGTNIYPSVYRALFEMVTEEPAWISAHLKLKGVSADEVSKALRFRRLLRIRKAAGNFIFQLQLHENPRIEADAYNDLMEQALGWKRTGNDADAYLASNDDYRSGGLLLGYVIAAQVRQALIEQWGPEWFRNEALADKLKAGARKGYGASLDEFLAVWGVSGFDAGALAGQVAER
jgi:hypothetical protein